MSTLFSIRDATTTQVVDTFLNFFRAKDHLHIGSAPLVPKNDKTLLFINSGMAPMKDYFLGLETPPQPTLCNIQSCIRTNDIEEVGDRHHLTYFEMLGSWSIGSYWKDRAISLAFELLTTGFGFPPDKLYATVYRGEPEKGIPADEESARHWVEAGLPAANVVPLGDDNFWGPAGDHGPCGPCTEVYFDTGPEFGPEYIAGGHFDDKSRYIEIWNAGVFMEYDAQSDGLKPLAMRSVDTGSGLERMVMTLNRKGSVYEIDSMSSILNVAQRLIGSQGSALDGRIVCDHARAAVHILAEGLLPSNIGRGYIPRRLLRRSLAALAQAQVTNLDLRPVIDAVYAELRPWNRVKPDTYDAVTAAILTESELFRRTLHRGLEKLVIAIPSKPPASLSGEAAFELFSTYGLPVDTMRDFVEKRGGKFDRASFDAAFARHQQVSRGGGKTQEDTDLLLTMAASTFAGHDAISGDGKILAILKDCDLVQTLQENEVASIVLDTTVFYPEGGGQVGDTGCFLAPHGHVLIETTKKLAGGQIVHYAKVQSGTLSVGDVVTLRVNESIRKKRCIHHTATHLLNAALRQVLGPHVEQRGSLVTEDRLRFDFSHSAPLDKDELWQVEADVNSYIRSNIPMRASLLPHSDAIAAGALGIFSEKYAQEVRMVAFGEISKELCFGTHANATGELGFFIIEGETASSRGVRRISACAGEAAYKVVRELVSKQNAIAELLGTNNDGILDAIRQRLGKMSSTPSAKDFDPASLQSGIEMLACGTKFLLIDIRDEVQDLAKTVPPVADALSAVVCCVNRAANALRVAVAIPATIPSLSASRILADLLPIIGGKGGGKPRFAMGGGGVVAASERLLAAIRPAVERHARNITDS